MEEEKVMSQEQADAIVQYIAEDAQLDAEVEALMQADTSGGKKKRKKAKRNKRQEKAGDPSRELPQDQPKKGKKKKILIGAAVAVVVLFGASKLFGGGGGQMTAPAIHPSRDLVQNRLSVSGPVSGTDSVDVVSNLHAEVLDISVKEGDRVEKGQILAVLDDADIQKELEMAKNNYDLAVTTQKEQEVAARNGYEKAVQDYQAAKTAYERTKVLFDGGSVPKLELETAENAMNDARRQTETFTLKDGVAVANDSYRLQVEKARFDYEKKQEELADTQIKAPIAGTVVRVNTKVGRFADQTDDSHQPLFIIENLDVLEMEIDVSEYSIGKVAVGQEAVISAAILYGKTISGLVTAISPTGEEKGGGSTERVIPTTIRIQEDNTGLLAGITARAEIVLEEAEDALCVPAGALIDRDGSTYVLAVNQGVVHWTPVTVGVEGDLLTEIAPQEGETLDENTILIASPNESYTEGMAVTAILQ